MKNEDMEKGTILELKNISKSFPGVKALDHVSFSVTKGSVHVLVGENGAGKSTLIKIINGIYVADEGEMYVNHKLITQHSPKLMRDLGIATIHQELSPVKDLTIAENIFLGREPLKKSKFIDWKKLFSDAQKLISDLGFTYNSKRKMGTLTVSDMQIIEIIKAISMNAQLIIMDEPTSSITDNEVRTLFKQVEKLKASGISIIYITHKMDEIMEIGDDASILRDGQLISTHAVKELTKDEIITKMVGREMNDVYPPREANIGEPILELKDLSREGAFSNVSLTLHKGEILGMAGLIGAGRTEVFRTIFGLDQYDTGEVVYQNKSLQVKKVSDAINAGIMMVSEDRKGEGLVLCRSVGENISLPNLNKYTKKLFIGKKAEKQDAETMVESLSIKTPTLSTPTGSLSGGNQQKIVISKWILHEPNVLIMDEPTRGIDVGAKYEIYKLMCDLAASGVGIIMISSELPEIIGVCDRVVVMSEGKVTGEVLRKDFSQERIMSFAVGGQNKDENKK